MASTITRRWPPIKLDYSSVNLLTTEMPDLAHSAKSSGSRQPTNDVQPKHVNHSPSTSVSTAAEDETEEMDALPEHRSDEHKEQQ
ncbi:MAG: hypothetical protein R2932_18360 [Caldilineaceae bacterium]